MKLSSLLLRWVRKNVCDIAVRVRCNQEMASVLAHGPAVLQPLQPSAPPDVQFGRVKKQEDEVTPCSKPLQLDRNNALCVDCALSRGTRKRARHSCR